ncbi:MAG TPA: CCA tRNA nucleotidyltransferase [Planctomycetota bacterium]|nr:CCA tRNA nucleotidyltransferase [Planctomycetota bacterium]
MDVARIDPAPVVPAAVGELLGRLRAAGGRVWLVGGTVRDLLLGVVPRDYDIATDLVPAQVARVLPDADHRHADLGACRVLSASGPVAITSLRADGKYGDHRHPDSVRFVREPEVDALRRDFTINALYLDVERSEILDFTGGRRDLAARTLRTIGEPSRRFGEDALRLLRGLRFAARFDLEIEAATAAAMTEAAPTLSVLSPERTFAELSDAFTSRGRGRALQLLVELGLAAVVLPEVAAMRGVTQPPLYHPEGDVLTHVCLVLDHVPEGDLGLAWSAVLHDVGKPPTWRLAADRIRFDGHDTLSARMADGILQRLRASTELRDLVVEICEKHIHFAALPQMRPRRRERWMRTPHFRRHLEFHRADCLGSHGKLEIYEFARAMLEQLPPVEAPLVVGKDVLALGIAEGPVVGRLLAQVQAAADESPTPMNRDEALVLLRDMVARLRQG